MTTATLDHALAARVCECSHARAKHGGKTGGGKCHDRLCACRRFAWLLADRAAYADRESPGLALLAHDARRGRSRKTARARAAGKWGVGPSDSGECRARVGFRERGWGEDYTARIADLPEPVVVQESSGGHDLEVALWPRDPEDKTAAVIGTAFHELLTKARRTRYPWRLFGQKVHVPGLDVPGEYDEWDPVTRVLRDYKTAGEWAWERLGESGPDEGKWDQLMEYGLGVYEQTGVEPLYVELLFVRRAAKSAADVETFRRPWSRDAALAAVARLHEVLDALDEARPLPRDRQGPSNDGICRGCPFRTACWGAESVALAEQRTVEGLMLAHDEPGIAKAALEYVEARESAKPFDEAQKVAGGLLRGVPEGRYGDVIVREVGGNKKWVPDIDARVEQLEQRLLAIIDGEAEPVDPAALPVPEKVSTSTVRLDVKRVRAATLEAERAAAAEEAAAAEPGA